MTNDRIVINDPDHGVCIGRAAGVPFHPGEDQCICRVKGEKLIGGAMFNNYTRASIAAHMAGFDPKWINRDLIWCVFHYVFEQLSVKKVFGQVPATNLAALSINKRLGFSVEHRVQDVFPDGDLIVMAMYKEHCRWLDYRPRALRWTRSDVNGGQIKGTSAA